MGAVYSDAQPLIKGRVEAGGKGLAGVVVSDGYSCTATDSDGNYELYARPDSRFVFVSTPAGYLPDVKEGSIPVFYKEIAGSDNYDFILKKNHLDDTDHVCIVQSDVQVISAENVRSYGKLLGDIVAYKSGISGKDVFGIDCGDIVGDMPSLLPLYKRTASRIGMPVYRAIGNHDMNYYGRSFETSYTRFEDNFGPKAYSFNRGKVHYIVIDNNFYVGRDYFYMGYIDERTLAWLENDISYVPKGSTVMVAMHIPTRLTPDQRPFTYDYDNMGGQTSNASALYGILEGYNAHIISGHMHYNLNVCFTDNLMEHNTAAVCGTWWCADVCLDGTPAGYAIYTVEGDDVKWIYKGFGHPETYQARAYLPGASSECPDCVVANVWNYDPEWKVELLEDGKVSCVMEQYSGFDPYAERMCRDKDRIRFDWIGPTATGHLFRARPSNPAARIEVKITDRFGNVYKVPAEMFVYP